MRTRTMRSLPVSVGRLIVVSVAAALAAVLLVAPAVATPPTDPPPTSVPPSSTTTTGTPTSVPPSSTTTTTTPPDTHAGLVVAMRVGYPQVTPGSDFVDIDYVFEITNNAPGPSELRVFTVAVWGWRPRPDVDDPPSWIVPIDASIRVDSPSPSGSTCTAGYDPNTMVTRMTCTLGIDLAPNDGGPVIVVAHVRVSSAYAGWTLWGTAWAEPSGCPSSGCAGPGPRNFIHFHTVLPATAIDGSDGAERQALPVTGGEPLAVIGLAAAAFAMGLAARRGTARH